MRLIPEICIQKLEIARKILNMMVINVWFGLRINFIIRDLLTILRKWIYTEQDLQIDLKRAGNVGHISIREYKRIMDASIMWNFMK